MTLEKVNITLEEVIEILKEEYEFAEIAQVDNPVLYALYHATLRAEYRNKERGKKNERDIH